jgi:hypothetical protein
LSFSRYDLCGAQMSRYLKNIRKKLRDLSDLAYERELGRQLEELYAKFEDWKNSRIDSVQLHNLIHEYNKKEGKEIWSTYYQTEADFLVARAYRLGILNADEIPQDVAEALKLEKTEK